MITFMESRVNLEDGEKCLDSQLWQACAGSMVQLPVVNSKVFYFPQGHAEHASGNVDFRNCPKVPSYIPCRVSSVKFLADSETDEVFSKLRLVPIGVDELDFDDGGSAGINRAENQEKPVSFAKTLTQSDANNGGGFSVPRYCAETIFPRLDYSADPPVQNILAKDVHGDTWKFRHIYRGTPRRHLLTTGWSTFVNHKKLVAGDSIVFMRAENGDLCVGIRRAKRGIGHGPEMVTGWNPAGCNSAVPYGGFSAFLREDENMLTRQGDASNGWTGRGKVKADDVIEAVGLAARGQPFDVVYYPRGSTPEFCVKAALIKTALRIRWCSGMRFKMAFETEDSSRISWFMGTISSAQVANPVQWPDSPWRLLQVTWDEPDLLQNVKRVNPWLVELVSNMPAIHLSSFLPPHKKLRLPPHSEFPLEGQIPVPAFSGNHLLGSGNPFGCLPNNTPAGMQGARHAQYSLSLPDIHLNTMRSGLLPVGLPPPNQACAPSGISNPFIPKFSGDENVSCLLTIGNPSQRSKNSDNGKAAPFILFGQPILLENPTYGRHSNTTPFPNHTSNNSFNGNENKVGNLSSGSGINQTQVPRPSLGDGFQSELNSNNGHCKVFLESDEVGRTLDLALLNSYDELYSKVASMFSIEISDMRNRVIYCDDAGKVRLLNDAPFSNFAKSARRLTILTDLSNDNLGV